MQMLCCSWKLKVAHTPHGCSYLGPWTPHRPTNWILNMSALAVDDSEALKVEICGGKIFQPRGSWTSWWNQVHAASRRLLNISLLVSFAHDVMAHIRDARADNFHDSTFKPTTYGFPVLQFTVYCTVLVHSFIRTLFRSFFFGGNGNRNHCAILNSENFFLYVPYCITYPACLCTMLQLYSSLYVYTVQVRQVFAVISVALPSQNVEHVRNYCRDVVSWFSSWRYGTSLAERCGWCKTRIKQTLQNDFQSFSSKFQMALLSRLPPQA